MSSSHLRPRRLVLVVAFTLSSAGAWAQSTAVAAAPTQGAGSIDDWIALLFALLAGLLCTQQRQH